MAEPVPQAPFLDADADVTVVQSTNLGVYSTDVCSVTDRSTRETLPSIRRLWLAPQRVTSRIGWSCQGCDSARKE